MNHTRSSLWQKAFTGLLSFMFVLVACNVRAQDMTAEEAVEQYMDILLERIVEIQDLYDSDRPAYFDAVRESLDEFVDFREAARGVMAQYSQGPDGATSEQLDRFAGVFRESMIDFYGSALASYNGERFELMRSRDSGNSNTADVRMLMTTTDGARIQLQYSMYVAPDERWKMRNLYIEGVNLRRQYHSRFDSMMSRYGNDIDAVIDNWLNE